MAGIAAAVRQSLIQCREPDYIYNSVTVASNRLLEVANAGKSFLLPTDDDSVFVNSNTV
jgi:hypothetical protein